LLPRLKTAEQFAAVLDASKLKAEGHGVWRSRHFVLHLSPLTTIEPPSATTTQTNTTVGVICPKRWAKRAVTRNTIKRQIYAVTHDLAPQLPRACLVLRLAAGFSREEFPSATSPALKRVVRAELLGLLGQVSRQERA
jgi:ribonuclease P protein component